MSFQKDPQSNTTYMHSKDEAFMKSARITFLLYSLFSLVNLVSLVTKLSTAFFFFSAWTPYFITDYAMAYTLKFPAENYGDSYNKYLENRLPDSAFIIALIISAVIILAYFVIWFISRRSKSRVPYVIGLVLTCIDTGMIAASLSVIPVGQTVIMCFLIHAIIIYQQFMGVRSAGYKK